MIGTSFVSGGRLFVVVIALLLLGAAATTPAAAQDDGTSTITIHNRLCPTEYGGDDVFADCHGNPQDSNLEFTIDGPVSDTAATDDEGDITFGDLPGGTYEISGGVPGEFADTFVYCSEDDDQSNVLLQSSDPVVSLELPDDTAVTCDWYNTPLDLSGDDDDTDDGPTLPNTGAGTAGTTAGMTALLLLAVGSASAVLGVSLRRRTLG